MPLNPPATHWRAQRVWIVGASSGIGLALAELLHARGAQVWLSARNADALHAFTLAHPGSRALALDVTDAAAVQAAAQQILTEGRLDWVCYCAGHYQPMRADAFDLAQALQHQQINLGGVWHLLAAVLPPLLQQRSGHISLVSSVAGFRGLPKSLAYGPTKAALINLAETLWLDVRRHGLGVSVVNPGFVATRLTAQNDFAMPALRTPQQAAQAVVRGWEAGRFHIHFPRRFTWPMLLLRLLPYRLYFAAVRRGTGL